MRHNLNTRWLKFIFASPLFLLAELLLPLSPTCAQSGTEADYTTHNVSEFVLPDLSYSSVFDQYHGYQDEAVTSWPEANAAVGRIGGWRFYLEEAAQPDQSDSKSIIPQQPLAPPLLEKPGKHTGHGGKP